MKHSYFNIEHKSTVHLMDIGDGWLITSVEVNQSLRGRGYASSIIKEVLEDADREQTTLFLSIEPDGTGLSEKELFQWYSRLGFASIEGSGPGIEISDRDMSRKPVSSTEEPHEESIDKKNEEVSKVSLKRIEKSIWLPFVLSALFVGLLVLANLFIENLVSPVVVSVALGILFTLAMTTFFARKDMTRSIQ